MNQQQTLPGITPTLSQGTCPHCEQPILWCTTASGRKIPLQTTRKTIVSATGDWHHGYEAHFAHCRHANMLRRKKA